MQIIGTVIFFNDEIALLKKALDSLSGADRIIAVDGTYADWPHGNIYQSNNALLDLVCSYPNAELIEANKPYPHQIDKRNAYLLGSDGDWYINVDADEEFRFHGIMDWHSLKIFLSTVPDDVAWLDVDWIFRPDLWEHGHYFTGRKIFKHIPGIHYAEHHAFLWDENKKRIGLNQGDKAETPWQGIRSIGMSIYHNKLERSQKRLHLQGEYYQTREHP